MPPTKDRKKKSIKLHDEKTSQNSYLRHFLNSDLIASVILGSSGGSMTSACKDDGKRGKRMASKLRRSSLL